MDIELSLDEIIKKRNIKPSVSTQKVERKASGQVKRLSPQKKSVVADARLKLLNKRRNVPRALPDARFRLEALRSQLRPVRRPLITPPRKIAGRLGRLLGGLRPMEVDLLDLEEEASFGPPLIRTIDNEMTMPSRRRPFDWDRPIEDDPMMDNVVIDRMNLWGGPTRRTGGFRPGAPDWDDITITVKTPLAETQTYPGILKRPTAVQNSSLIVPKPPGSSGLSLSQRFNQDRNAKASATVEALKAQLLATKRQSAPPKQEEGHRIIVSNLLPTVTQEDVQELFGDIGELISSKLVKPGVAEVVYVHLEDAQKAVENYHNRQLDKQPMKCLLVKNQSRKSGRPAVELDMATLRNALHNRVPS